MPKYFLREIFPGKHADAPCYFPAWQRMVETIGSLDFFINLSGEFDGTSAWQLAYIKNNYDAAKFIMILRKNKAC